MTWACATIFLRFASSRKMEINELGMPIDKHCDASANQQK
jgi:hypothetical protein